MSFEGKEHIPLKVALQTGGLPTDNETEKYSGLLTKNGVEVNRNNEKLAESAERYNIPYRDVRYIDLNRTGIYLPNREVKVGFRARFLAEVPTPDSAGKRKTWFALPVRSEIDSAYTVSLNRLLFDGEEMGTTDRVELDTCDVSYQRGPHLLNLNSRSRSDCSGCQACVHNYKDLYDKTVLKDQGWLRNREQLAAFFDQKERLGMDVAKLDQIAVVTGLFGKEKLVLGHLEDIKRVVEPRGFQGELMYMGCEIESSEGLRRMADLGNVALIYAIDNFTRREEILNRRKGCVNMDQAKDTLMRAKQMGIKTSFSYIAGIDDLSSLEAGFDQLRESITRFPVVNIYQIQTQGQMNALNEAAKHLEYYVQVRKIIEKAMAGSGLKPRPWENYRPLWYDSYEDKILEY